LDGADSSLWCAGPPLADFVKIALAEEVGVILDLLNERETIFSRPVGLGIVDLEQGQQSLCGWFGWDAVFLSKPPHVVEL
jgi:hypothetical protein